MQRALIIRSVFDRTDGHAVSREVDAPEGEGETLRQLLADGWRVVHACSMTSELDSCCLVVVEKADPDHDPSLTELGAAAEPTSTAPVVQGNGWDGESIPLESFGLDRS